VNISASVYIATSLDGFIAGKNGALDWLDDASETVSAGEDCGYQAFMEAIDILVMGRKNYQKVLSFGKWPYENKPTIVLSRNKIIIPEHLTKTVSHSSETPKALCQRLAIGGPKRLYIDGGITIQRFLADGLIDHLTLTIIPIILGGGIPLFGELKKAVHLEHIVTKSYPFGFVQSTYKVLKKEQSCERARKNKLY